MSEKISIVEIVRSSAFSVKNALAWAPRVFIPLCFATFAAAGFPALQFWLVLASSEAIASGNTLHSIVAIAVLGITVGGSRALTDAMLSLGTTLSSVLNARYNSMLVHAAAAAPVREIVNGSAITRVRELRDAVKRHISSHADASISSLKAIVTAGLLVAAIAPMNLGAALLTIGALIPTLIAFSIVSRREAPMWPRLARHTARAAYLGDQVLYEKSGVEISTLGAGDFFAERARREEDRYAQLHGKMLLHSGIVIAASGLASGIFVALSLYVLAASPGGGPAAVTAGIVGVLSGLAATADAGFTWGMLMSATRPVMRFRAFAGDHSTKFEPARHVSHSVDRLEVRNATVSYGSDTQPAVSDVSLTVERGCAIALVGVNGAGKTTLVSAIVGVADLDTGEILYDGSAGVGMSVCSYLPQEFGKYELTVREFITLGVPAELSSERDIWSALGAAGARNFVTALPGGLDQQLGSQQTDGVGLSGGQWQRLALARTHLRRSPVVVLDEPTSAVDAIEEMRIFDDLLAEKSDRITIVVSHRASNLRRMDRIYVMDAGRIIESGTFSELQANRGPFYDLFKSQLGRSDEGGRPG